MARTFEDKPAVREAIPLLIGLTGPSGSGKTYSALRLATGIQRVSGGDIFVGDSEAKRSLHYAEKFKFRHVPFGAPFSPMDYLALLDHCVNKGAKTIVVDSTSHLHEGPGGVLEMHDSEVTRMGGRDSDSFRAWAKPKADLRRLINAMTQKTVNFIFCFRAKQKVKPEKGSKELKHLGWMPIASDELIYEMTTSILLYPGSNGIPTWQTSEVGEKSIIKLPNQFRQLFGVGGALDEDIGQKMGEWAAGGAAPRGNVDPAFLANRDKWISLWEKKGVGSDRVLAALGRATVDDITRGDLDTLNEYLAAIKAKKTSLGETFPSVSSAPPDDDDEPGADDGEDRGDDPMLDAKG
jgi:hypothetical protein